MDSNSLRVRLAKAEAAVETERRTIQVLEQKLKDNQEQEQDISTLRAELSLSHKREEELERRLAERNSSHAAPNTPPESKSIREAQKRAEEAEQAAKLLQIQLDSSSQTIMKLSDEVNDLTTRLNEQADIIISMRQNMQPQFDTVPLTAPHLMRTSSSPAHQQYNEPYQEIQTCPPDRSDEKHHVLETEKHYQTENQQQEDQIWTIPGARIESIRSIPEAPRLGSTANSTGDAFPDGNEAPTPPRKIGFWQWVAGADLASTD
jgi:DNA repair exonuclease SbcCD ATPase subunit